MSTATYAPDAADQAAYRATEKARDVTRLRLDGDSGATLAKDDPDLIVGIALCKPGLFNGYFPVTVEDLHAYVTRFDALAGTFRPPMRIDHSFGVMDVIGRFVALRVEDRPDGSIGGTEVPMLVGDVRLVGTQLENELIRTYIATGKLDERSSEFWPYVTNAGAEYPLVFAGAAFVDIPAVEGLGSITLRREELAADHEEHTMSTTPAADEQAPADEATEVESQVEPLPGAADEQAPAAAEGAEAEHRVDDGEEEAEGVGTVDEGDDEGEDAGNVVVEATPAAEAAELRVAGLEGITLTTEQRAALDAHVTAQVEARTLAASRFETAQKRGVVPLTVADTVRGLLTHADPAVREGMAAYLAAAKPPVNLRHEAGNLASTPPVDTGSTSPDELRELSREEFGPLWAALTSEQRKAPEYVEAYRKVMTS